MSKLTALVLFLVVNAITLPTQLLADQAIHHAGSFRIAGGTIAENGAYPFMVSLRKHPIGHFCGGSIVNNLWVLTAAHCLSKQNVSRLIAVVGTNMLDSGGIAVRVESVVMHPYFNETGIRPDDIALIRLASPLRYSSTVAAVTLDLKGSQSIDVTLIGWGSTKRRGPALNRLQQYSTQIIRQAVCTRQYSHITEKQFCTKLKRGSGSCDGDSGGPLIDSDTKVQVGIATFSALHGCGIAPDVYTRVSSYIPWILATANP
ncbi:hypothetical protein Trydic_g12393 [Trypoxylus dichotomus]